MKALLVVGVVVVGVAHVVEEAHQLLVVHVHVPLFVLQLYVLVEVLLLDKLRVLGLILGLGRLAALRAVLLGDPGLLEAEGGGALSEVGLEEGARPPVVVVGDVLEGHLLLPEDLALDPGRGEDGEEGPDGGDDESDYVDDSDAGGRVEVDGGLPEVEAEGEDEEGELEGLVDEPDEVLSEGDGVGEPPEEVVLVDPVLHDEDEDEDGGAEREHEAVPADDVGVDDVEGVACGVAEGGVLEGLVELDLEEVDGLIAGVLAGVEEVGDGGGRQHHLPDDADEPRDDHQTLDLVDEAVSGERVDGLHEVEDRVDDGGVDGLGYHYLDDQLAGAVGLGLVALHVGQLLDGVAEDVVDDVGEHRHQPRDGVAEELGGEGGPHVHLALGYLPELQPHQQRERYHQQHEQDAVRVEHVLAPLAVAYLHVVPEDVGRLVGLGDLKGGAADLEELGVLLVLLDEVVAVVLELEADEGLPGELGEGEGGAGVEGELLAEVDELLVEHVDAVGDVGHQVGLLELGLLVLGDELVDQLGPQGVDVLDLGEVVAEGDAGDYLVVLQQQVVAVGVLELGHNALPEVLLDLALALLLGLVLYHLLEPLLDFCLQDVLQLALQLEFYLVLGGVLVEDELGDVLDQDREVVLGDYAEVEPVPDFAELLPEDEEEDDGEDGEGEGQDVDGVDGRLVGSAVEVVAGKRVGAEVLGVGQVQLGAVVAVHARVEGEGVEHQQL